MYFITISQYGHIDYRLVFLDYHKSNELRGDGLIIGSPITEKVSGKEKKGRRKMSL